MKKNIYFIILCAVAGLWLLTMLLKKQAAVAKDSSDEILRNFKTIDAELGKPDSLILQLPDTNKTTQ